MLSKYKAITGSFQGFEHHPVLCVGDVVLFQMDFTRPVMVGRVAAGPHHEMLSTDPGDSPFKVPAFHFWVSRRHVHPPTPTVSTQAGGAALYTLVDDSSTSVPPHARRCTRLLAPRKPHARVVRTRRRGR